MLFVNTPSSLPIKDHSHAGVTSRCDKLRVWARRKCLAELNDVGKSKKKNKTTSCWMKKWRRRGGAWGDAQTHRPGVDVSLFLNFLLGVNHLEGGGRRGGGGGGRRWRQCKLAAQSVVISLRVNNNNIFVRLLLVPEGNGAWGHKIQ